MLAWRQIGKILFVETSVVDPWHFCTNPYPRIRASANGSGSGSGSCYFRPWPSKRQQKKFFCLLGTGTYFLKIHLHHFSNIKSNKEVTKQEESRFFLLFLLDDRRIRSQIQEAQIKNLFLQMLLCLLNRSNNSKSRHLIKEIILIHNNIFITVWKGRYRFAFLLLVRAYLSLLHGAFLMPYYLFLLLLKGEQICRWA